MRNTISLPDINYLNECFTLLDSGVLIWNNRPLSHFQNPRKMEIFNKNFSGKIAGCKRNDGYIGIKLLGKMFKAHRVIYRIAHGEIPYGFEVDHRDGVHTDNSPSNLRLASTSQNGQNRKNRSDNACGVKGVWYCKSKKKFLAQVMRNGIKRTEKFNSLSDAESWVVSNRKEMHGDFANNGVHTGELK